MAVIHERGETRPLHGEVIRLDARRPGAPPGVRPIDAPEPRTAVLVVHGFKGFKDWGFFPHVCERLAADGHAVVSFNGSRNGVGPSLMDFTDLEGFGTNTYSHEVGDVHHMLDHLTSGVWTGGRPPDAVGILGHSRGGGVGVVAASERDDIASLATWAAISTFYRWTPDEREEWARRGVVHVANARTGQQMPLYREVLDDLEANRRRFDVLAAAGRVKAPWLVVHGTEDATVPLAEAEALAQAGPDARLEVVAGSGHAFEAVHPFEGPTPGLDRAVDATVRHFRSSLGG